MRIIDKIHMRLKEFQSYPKGVLPVSGRIEGTSFFPGGDGLWKERCGNVDITKHGVMIVGHNFDKVAGFEKSLADGKESLSSPTWRNIVRLLIDSSIPLEECYFTNTYVGLIDAASNVGKFPGAKCPEFVDRCLKFLEYQIEAQSPRAILTLGNFVPSLVSTISPNLSDWKEIKTLVELDSKSSPIVKGASFCEGRVRANVVALTHPAQRHLNVVRRKYKGLIGDAAECIMLQESVVQKIV